jgi:hypothetical protein
MPTFTFPSGATVEAPDGLPLCERPETVTEDVGRSILVGLTRSDRPVFSTFSCAAYAALGRLFTMRGDVAYDRRRAERLEARGRTWQAGNVRRHADEREARNERLLARMVADPAPCTCVIPYVPAVELAEEVGVLKADVLEKIRDRADRMRALGGRDVEQLVFRLGPDGEVLVAPITALSLRMHFAQPAHLR